MKNIDLNLKDRRIIHKLYVNERVIMKGENEVYEEAEIEKSVKQNAIYRLRLLNVYI